MHRWVRALFLDNTLFTSAQRAALLPDEGYKSGIQHQRMEADDGWTVEVLMHTGQIAGTFAWVAFVPEAARYVVVLSNIGFTFPQAQPDSYPTWSPDGTRIAFRSDRSGNIEVWSVNASGTGSANRAQHQATDCHPGWTAGSGSFIAAARSISPAAVAAVVPSGKVDRSLSSATVESPCLGS
jgi:hypothetical protein